MIEDIANRLGYDYTPIPNFPMPWYSQYGVYILDYVFDRFEPRNLPAKILKAAAIATVTPYAISLGLLLTLAGNTCSHILHIGRKITGRNQDQWKNSSTGN